MGVIWAPTERPGLEPCAEGARQSRASPIPAERLRLGLGWLLCLPRFPPALARDDGFHLAAQDHHRPPGGRLRLDERRQLGVDVLGLVHAPTVGRKIARVRHLFGSIEDRAGMNKPGYQPPADAVETADTPDAEWPVWTIAVLFPLAGIIWGIVWLARDRIGPGLGLIFAALLSAACWTAVILALTS
jgi:hypothetical protein